MSKQTADTQKSIQKTRSAFSSLFEQVIAFLNRKQEMFTANYLFGMYRGTVEYVNDPLNIGRLKVRIPFMHGDQKLTATPELPWALRCEVSGGGFDHGSVHPFRIGDSVCVIFESGNPNYPIVIGAWKGVPKTPQRHGTIETVYKGEKVTLPLKKPAGGTWYGEARPEAPTEAQDTINNDPTVTIPFKTFKGHTIIANDADGAESLEIIDRGGQGFLMRSPITEDDNDENKARRGNKKARDGEALPREKMVDEDTEMQIYDILSQGISLSGSKGSEGLQILSKENEQNVSGLAPNRAELKINTGEKRVVIEGYKDNTKSASIVLNMEDGSITLNSNKLKLEVDWLRVKNLDVRGRLNVYEDIMAQGNIFSMGDGVHKNTDISKYYGEKV